MFMSISLMTPYIRFVFLFFFSWRLIVIYTYSRKHHLQVRYYACCLFIFEFSWLLLICNQIITIWWSVFGWFRESVPRPLKTSFLVVPSILHMIFVFLHALILLLLQLYVKCGSWCYHFPCVVEEFVMGNVKARCVSYAKLLSNALVVFA